VCGAASYIQTMTKNSPDPGATDRHSISAHLTPQADGPLVSNARYRIGDKVRHRVFGFRGVIFDVDPVFANSEEWYEAIPEEVRPRRDQPFYHLFADNGEAAYVAYVSQQNLEVDPETAPIDHPAINKLFREDKSGRLEMDPRRWH
jgi:heat shock protein HspQ